jgi:hypothetical protein
VTTVTLGVSGEDSLIRDVDDTFDIEFTGTLTAVITTAGAGGLQTSSSEAANTWYQVCVIADSTATNPVAALLIPAGVAFSQSGYDKVRRVGWVRNNGSSNFFKFEATGNAIRRRYHYDESTTNLEALNNGNATTWATVSLAAYVPPNGTEYLQQFDFIANAAGDNFSTRPTGSSVAMTGAPFNVSPAVATGGNEFRGSILATCNSSQSIQYEVTSASDSLDIAVIGFIDEI